MKKYLTPGNSFYKTLSIIAFITLTVLLVIPGDAFPEDKLFGRIFLDKIIHVIIFGGMMFCFYMWRNNTSASKKLLIAGIVYGILMEFVQKYFCYHRAFEYTDMVADAIGCLLAYLVAERLIHTKKK
jgi:VanZ family protein